ncbi:site-specific DNA-methyltransferase [Patescibacteria group bacterium]|nr:site-specific DNA-methyltransferase [Patescibacteria group bacterium]
MSFKYNPPTRTFCGVCEKLSRRAEPKITTHNGKASSADNFPFHNWYNFVLGYSPEFPDYLIKKERIKKGQLVADPFMGSGTTLVCCKSLGINSSGIDANDFFELVARVKLNWDIDTKVLESIHKKLLAKILREMNKYDWDFGSDLKDSQQLIPLYKGKFNPKRYAGRNRPKLLVEKYISDAPFAKLCILKEIINKHRYPSNKVKEFFIVALASVILPSSNIRYGPGFGVVKPKRDMEVVGLFNQKVRRMIDDLKYHTNSHKTTISDTILGDARLLSTYYSKNSVDFMVTSPPYPGDHEYTKHSRLELIFMGFATNLDEFRVIKKRMLRGSTTNVYKEDKAGSLIKDIASIEKVANEIEKRVKEDGGTSGFEKLYSKLVREYFGGMYQMFQQALIVLKPGAKFSLLVSDSHAFKMVHIETAKLLAEVAMKAGFVNYGIELWQLKNSTSHKYKLFEDILTLQKGRN